MDVNIVNIVLVYYVNCFYVFWEGGGGVFYYIKLFELDIISI